MHPQPRVHFALVKSTRVNEYTGITRRSRTQWFYDLFRALPGDRALLPPSSADMFLSKPGWADLNSANLTPASGRQDHTTSPYAATSLVRSLGNRSRAEARPAIHRAQNAAASTASLPASVTIMIRPSCGVGWREFVEMICPTGEANIFANGTGQDFRPCARRANHSAIRCRAAMPIPTCPRRLPMTGSTD